MASFRFYATIVLIAISSAMSQSDSFFNLRKLAFLVFGNRYVMSPAMRKTLRYTWTLDALGMPVQTTGKPGPRFDDESCKFVKEAWSVFCVPNGGKNIPMMGNSALFNYDGWVTVDTLEIPSVPNGDRMIDPDFHMVDKDPLNCVPNGTSKLVSASQRLAKFKRTPSFYVPVCSLVNSSAL